MPTSVSEGFRTLSSNLEITDLQASVVATRQQNVRDAVARDLTVVDSFLTGSYRRSTMIAPLAQADVDVFVLLDPQYFYQHRQTPSTLLELVRVGLRKTYPQTPRVSKNGQAVTVTFTDFMVDVVPAFNRQGGGYLIPDANGGRWLETDPAKHVEIWTAANKWHQGNLVPLMKMMKGWNRKHSELLRSFHLEALVLALLNNVTITDTPSGIRYFFDKARQAVAQALLDPAGYGGNIGSYLGATVSVEVVGRLQTACERAAAAETAIGLGQIALAYEKYRLIFDDYFPAYGN